jgi:hypothetical protein
MGILSSSAGEGATIVFDQAPAANDGTISFDGTAAGVLVGTNIVFTNISGDGTDNDAFPIDCAGCLLNFTTGSIISVVGNIYTFAGGGTFTITGGSLLAGIPGGTTLLSGTWDNPVVVEVTPTTLDMLEKGTDTKHEDLLDYFFVDPPSDWIFTDVAIQIESEAGGVVKFAGPTYTGFSADLDFGGNADLVNSSAVPEPASALLLLLGLGSLAAYRRRTN